MPRIHPLLIAEDEPDDIFFVKRAIAKAGIPNPVHVVEDGQKLMDYLSGAGQYADRVKFPTPMLLLLDLKLPCVSGLDVLKWIRQKSDIPWLPVIVLSSSTLPADVAEAYTSGANSYVLKPGDPELLTGVMRDFAAWWLTRNVWPE